MNYKYSKMLFVSILFLTMVLSSVMALDTGWMSPSANSNSGWSNPDYAYASDDTWAVASTHIPVVNYYNFGFAIPDGSIIDGIEVKTEGYHTDNRLAYVDLSWDGGTSYTSIAYLPDFGTSESVIYKGGSTNTWNRTWSSSEFSDTNFRIRYDATGGQGDLLIDQVQVKVYYTEPVCGDGIVNGDEECEPEIVCMPGPVVPGIPPCSVFGPFQSCTTQEGYAGEQECTEQCTWGECLTDEYCGDGIINDGEQCDDGNNENGDGCSAKCETEIPVPEFGLLGATLAITLSGLAVAVLRRR